MLEAKVKGAIQPHATGCVTTLFQLEQQPVAAYRIADPLKERHHNFRSAWRDVGAIRGTRDGHVEVLDPGTSQELVAATSSAVRLQHRFHPEEPSSRLRILRSLVLLEELQPETDGYWVWILERIVGKIRQPLTFYPHHVIGGCCPPKVAILGHPDAEILI